MVRGPGPLRWDEERLLPRIQAAGCSCFMVVRLCLLAHAWYDTALHASVGMRGLNWPVQGQIRIAAAFRSPREALCQRLAGVRSSCGSGTPPLWKRLLSPSRSRELLRDRAMNCGSCHGQVTMAPAKRGRVSLRSRSEMNEVEEMVSARGRPYL